MRAVPGLLAKDGFEGVQVAALPDGRAIAVKIADGANRARMPVTAAALALAGVDPALLAPFGEAGTARGLAVAGELRDALSTHRPTRNNCDHPRPPAASTTCSATGTSPPTPTGACTPLRARENFPITGTPIAAYPHLIDGARRGQGGRRARQRRARAARAAERRRDRRGLPEIRAGALHDQFVVDVIQGGAGTSTNMNANEVIANRALELLGHAKGDYAHLHPNEHVNLSQSTNDVYPTAVKIATITAVRELARGDGGLQQAFAAKADEFRDVLKMGRTQLQDAVPMTLGQEFGAYAVMLGEDRQRLDEAVALLHEINLGATAIGTGLNAPAGYAAGGLPPPRRDHRPAAGDRRRPRRGDPGLRRVRPAVRRAQADRGEALQDLQRPAAAVVRAARRPRRDQPAAGAGRFVASCPARSTR